MIPAAASVARLHVVTDDDVVSRDDWVLQALNVLEVGGGSLALHLRSPSATAATLFELAEKLLPHARRFGALLIVNDRVDVAAAAGADGVHLGGRSLSVTDSRRVLGSSAVVGRSCHSAADVAEARSGGADYGFVGHVFETESHPGLRGVGPAGLRSILTTAGTLPVIAIGGISPSRVADVLDAGAYGVAVLRGIWEAPHPGDAVSEYLSRLSTKNEAG